MNDFFEKILGLQKKKEKIKDQNKKSHNYSLICFHNFDKDIFDFFKF